MRVFDTWFVFRVEGAAPKKYMFLIQPINWAQRRAETSFARHNWKAINPIVLLCCLRFVYIKYIFDFCQGPWHIFRVCPASCISRDSGKLKQYIFTSSMSCLALIVCSSIEFGDICRRRYRDVLYKGYSRRCVFYRCVFTLWFFLVLTKDKFQCLTKL